MIFRTLNYKNASEEESNDTYEADIWIGIAGFGGLIYLFKFCVKKLEKNVVSHFLLNLDTEEIGFLRFQYFLKKFIEPRSF